MSSIFSKIIAGEIPCYKIAEDNKHLAFLDINPNTKGHTLCIPKKEVDKIFDLQEDDYLDLMSFSRRIARALEEAIPCKRVGIVIAGLEVPHAHVHLIPMKSIRDLSFENKKKLNSEEFEEIAKCIKIRL